MKVLPEGLSSLLAPAAALPAESPTRVLGSELAAFAAAVPRPAAWDAGTKIAAIRPVSIAVMNLFCMFFSIAFVALENGKGFKRGPVPCATRP
jgi:hypothetical protein